MNYQALLADAVDAGDDFDTLSTRDSVLFWELIAARWEADGTRNYEPLIEGRPSLLENFWGWQGPVAIARCGQRDLLAISAQAAFCRQFAEIIRDYYEEQIREDFHAACCYRDSAEQARDLMVPARSAT